MTRALIALSLLVLAAGCRNCDDLGSLAPQGSIDPPIFDFGPLTIGQECRAILAVVNSGRTDLDVTGGVLTDVDGDWELAKVPTLVELGAREDLIVEYVATGDNGDRQSALIELDSDDPDDGGKLRATVTALLTDAAGPMARSACTEADDVETTPCTLLDFGATQAEGAGTIASVAIVNEGTADLTISNLLFNQTNPDFAVESVRRGTTEQVGPPWTVLSGRTADCGTPSGNDNTLIVDIRYTPSAIGADVDELVVLTDALESDGTPGGSLTVPLSGFGSDVGIGIVPSPINFGAVPEGQSSTIDVRVSNFGTSSASVNISCIDLEDDGQCEARCTGAPADNALPPATLTCNVTTVDGGDEGDGFVLAASDARDGGDDERVISITWAPAAGAATIPGTAVLALQSNILGDATFKAQILAGALGTIEASVASDDTCPAPAPADVCIEASGTPGDDPTDWSGELTLRLTNTGDATVAVTDVSFEDGGAAGSIADDYGAAPITDAALAPGEHGDIVISYDDVGEVIASSATQLVNVVITHSGQNGQTIVTLTVIPPQ